MEVKPVAWAYELAHVKDQYTGEYSVWNPRVQFEKPDVPPGSIRNLVALYPAPPVPTSAHQAAELFLEKASLPTSDGVTRLPIAFHKVREMLVHAIANDRFEGATLDIEQVVERVTGDLIGSEGVYGTTAINMVRSALKYAQASGARFKAVRPTEDDYAEAVAAACEAFMTDLKSKGIWE